MKISGFNITVQQSFPSVSACNAENRSVVLSIHHNKHGTFQIDQLNSQIFNTFFLDFLNNRKVLMVS